MAWEDVETTPQASGGWQDITAIDAIPAQAPVDEGLIPDYIEKPFVEGLERTIEGVPQVLSNIGGGMVAGLGDLGRAITSVPTPLDLLGVTEKPETPKIFDRVTSLGQNIAFDPTSPEFAVGQFIAPVPPVGRLGKVGKGVKTAYGKAVEKLPLDARRKATIALDKLDDIGAKNLSVDTRAKLLDEMALPAGQESIEDIGQNVHKVLIRESKKSYKLSDDAYDVADDIAKDTGTFDTRNTIDALSSNVDGRGGIPSKALKKKRKAYNEIRTMLKDDNIVTAKGIEDKLKVLKEDQRAAKPNISYLYGRAIEDLEEQQRNLLGVKNQEVYTEARELYKTWRREFSGDIDGFGSTGGKSIESVMKAKDNFNVTESLLGGKLDANKAQQIGKNFTAQEKRDMAFSVLAKGIDDTDGLNTPENVYKLIDNFEAAKASGSTNLRILLGDKGYVEAKKSIDTLSFVQAAIKAADSQTADIGQDIVELGAALAASKISPYAAVHVAINKSKNIINKKAFGTMKNQLIARTKEIKDSKAKRMLLKALNDMRYAQPIGVATEQLGIDTE